MTDDDKKILRFKRPGEPNPVEEPIIAEETATEDAAPAPKTDELLVHALEQILDGARKGVFKGLALLTMKTSDNSFHRAVGIPNEETADATRLSGFAMLGALNLVEDDLRFLAMQNYPSLAEVLSEGVEG